MYAMTTTEQIDGPVDFKVEQASELFYWRKHPDLHGWMAELYATKGGTKEFNCATLELTAEDINRLEDAIKQGSLPKTSGFFFGCSEGCEAENDLAFVGMARTALREGLTVFYDSWW